MKKLFIMLALLWGATIRANVCEVRHYLDIHSNERPEVFIFEDLKFYDEKARPEDNYLPIGPFFKSRVELSLSLLKKGPDSFAIGVYEGTTEHQNESVTLVSLGGPYALGNIGQLVLRPPGESSQLAIACRIK